MITSKEAVQPTSIALVSEAKRQLAQATKIDDVLAIRDRAEAVRMYVRQQRDSLEAQNSAAEIKCRAERRAGELLKEMAANGQRPKGRKKESHDATLFDLGIAKDQSSRWQIVADVPEDRFDEYIEQQKAEAEEITSADLIRMGAQVRRQKKRNDTQPTGPIPGDPRVTIHQGDALDILKTMDAESVHCVVTSPPYWD